MLGQDFLESDDVLCLKQQWSINRSAIVDKSSLHVHFDHPKGENWGQALPFQKFGVGERPPPGLGPTPGVLGKARKLSALRGPGQDGSPASQ